MSEEGLRAASEKMRADGVADAAIDVFAHYYRELEAGATPTDEDAAKIKDAIDALGGVPGTEHLRPHPEPVAAPEEPEDSHVNGWDEELVGDSASS